MPKVEGVNGKLRILQALAEKGELSIRDLERETGLNWNAIYYWLRNRDNDENLVVKGCVEEVRVVDETLNRAQDMYKYRITEFGLKVCLPFARMGWKIPLTKNSASETSTKA